MANTCKNESIEKAMPDYDRMSELKAFDDTKAGVKGLVDSGITKIPRIFHIPSHDMINKNLGSNEAAQLRIPTIDLGGLAESDPNRRKAIVEQVREASETRGFFYVVNHGIPLSVLEEMKNGVRRFFEQDDEKKKEFYTRDVTRIVGYHSNFDLFVSAVANWRDTLYAGMAPNPPKPGELPEACRLLSEALGLEPDHLKNIECAEGLQFVCHYYPACPEPELTIGTPKHSDNDFLTVLLQDHVGGLQVFCDNQWFDVPPVPGSLVINIGDLLQLITNDKFKSIEHRVLANREPRVSVACLFSTGLLSSSRLYGPIKELLSEENPAIYRETTIHEYVSLFTKLGVINPLEMFKL